MLPPSLHVGHLLLPWSGLLGAGGLVAALLLSRRTAVQAGLAADAVWDAGVVAVVTAFLLSRALLVAADPRSFLGSPFLILTVPSLTISGVLGTLLVMVLYLRRHGLALLGMLDAAAAPGAVLLAALATGHLLEGSDLGMPTALPWGLRATGSPLPEHPVGLYAAVGGLALAAVLLRLPGRRRAPGVVGAMGLIAAGVAEFLLSFVREPLLPEYSPTPLVEPQQWMALAIAVAGALVLLKAQPAPARQVAETEAVHAL